MTADSGSLVSKCVDCKKSHDKKFDDNLAKRIENTCKFCDPDISIYCLMLGEGIYLYAYMDSLVKHCQIKKNSTEI